MDSRKKPARFTEDYDLKLLREVVAVNPFNAATQWQHVAASVSNENFTIDGRRARERTHLMVFKFKKEQADALKKSGIDEAYTEKDTLLQEVVDMIADANAQTLRVKEKTKSEDAAAKDLRKRAMEGMKKDDDCRPKSKKLNALSFLQAKQDSEAYFRTQELELKKQELDLQCQRFDLEKEERRAALEMQKKQTEMLMMMMSKNK